MTAIEKDVYEIFEDVKTRGKGLDDYQAMRIAIEIQRNSIIADAFMVRVPAKAEDPPVALEAIAMALGMDGDR